MKRIQSIFYVATMIGGILSVASCSNEDEVATVGKQVPLEVQVDGVQTTRSIIEGSKFVDDCQYGIFAMKGGGTTVIDNGMNVCVNYSKGTSTLSKNVYLPEGVDVPVYAYYPYNANYSNIEYLLQMPIDATTQTDYLYGYSADSDNRLTYVNTEQPKANIYFKHAMARVTMRIKKSADNEKTYKFPYINLLNVDKSAYVNVLEDGAILDASGTSNLTAKPSDYALENSDNEIVADFLVIPGNTEGKKIMLNMSDNISSFENGLSAAVPVTNWEAGQQYTYMVTIKNHYSLSITEADITPWDSINQEEMTADRTATSVGGTVGEAVDLGLSVKWASWNVGASTPEETGGLYGWADPTGAKWSRSNDDFPNANPPSDIQNTDYDIAHVQWGKEWFIPSDTERKELVEKCKWTRTTLNGVDGYKVSSTTNGNSIFLPCTGYRDGSPWFYSPSTAGKGCYWTSTGSSSYTDGIFSVHILCWEDNSNINYTSNAVTSARRYGYAVRPVTIQ